MILDIVLPKLINNQTLTLKSINSNKRWFYAPFFNDHYFLGENEDARLKAEKIKIAIEKIKEASVKKLFIKVIVIFKESAKRAKLFFFQQLR